MPGAKLDLGRGAACARGLELENVSVGLRWLVRKKCVCGGMRVDHRAEGKHRGQRVMTSD